MEATEYCALMNWLKDPKRKPAAVEFTAGAARQAAYAIEGSGILTGIIALESQVAALESQLAAQASAVEVLGKVEEMLRAAWEMKVELGSCKLDDDGSIVEGFYASNESHVDDEIKCYHESTLLEALAALVNGQEGKEEL